MFLRAYLVFFLIWIFASPTKSRSAPRNTSLIKIQHEFTRNAIKDFEENIRVGAFYLNENERNADDMVRAYKKEEIDAGLRNSSNFLASRHFFHAKKKIEQSKVFKLIQKMPKGALMHGHLSAMVSSKWLLKNVTYRSGVILYNDHKNVTMLTFKQPDPPTEWNYVADLRESSDNVSAFDAWLESKFNLYTRNPEQEYPDIDVVWTTFENMFSTTHHLVRYVPVFKDYVYQMLKELADDNVMYAELRSGFGTLYDETGKIYNATEHAEILIMAIDDFKRDHRNFFGAKVIYSGNRARLAVGDMRDIENYLALKRRFPQFIVGFDVSAQETFNNTNFGFIEALKSLPTNTKFMFHAGETNWYGSDVDGNLIDAILMNTTRIGHGYALIKHPYLLDVVKKNRIGIEVNPISNQILHLVYDMRNHPASFYLSQGFSVCISSDDPGFWEVTGLSYDFYYAFMAIAPADAGLETLKKFAWTSLEQAVLTDSEWMKVTEMFHDQWDKFIQDLSKEAA